MNLSDILAGGVRLVRTEKRAVVIWGVLNLLASGAMLLLFRPMFLDLFAFQEAAMLAQAQGLPPPTPPGEFFLAILGMNVVVAVLLAVIFAAAMRAVAGVGDGRFGYLRLGGDELRLLGLTVILWFGLIGIMIVWVLALAIVAGMAAALTPALGILIGFILFAAGLAAIVWACIRVSLTGAFTVLRGRIALREGWRATRGRFWTLFGLFVIIALVAGACTMAVLGIFSPMPVGAVAGMAPPEQMAAVMAQQREMMARPFDARMLGTYLAGGLVNAIAIAFTFGAIATAAIGYDRADHA